MIRVVYYGGTSSMDISHIVMGVTWSGDITQAARKIEVSLKNVSNFYHAGKKRIVNIVKGKEIRFYWKEQELFRGIIFSDTITSSGDHTVIAYDTNIYLTKNQDTKKYAKMTASAIISSVCSEFGIPKGAIANTGYVIPKLIMRDKSLYDIFITALTLTKKNSNKNYILGNTEGKLTLRERKDQPIQWLLENGVNILLATYAQSIEDMRNQIKVVGGSDEKPIISTVKDSTLIKTYGLMQHLESASSDLSSAQINALAKQLLKQLAVISDDATIVALGQPSVIAGKSIYVKETMTNIMGSYYVSTDSHEFESKSHKMTLTLSATDDLPEMEYEEPKETKATSTKKTKTEKKGG